MHQQFLHLRRLGYRYACWGESFWLHHQRGWKEAKVGVFCKGEDLPIFWGGLRKG